MSSAEQRQGQCAKLWKHLRMTVPIVAEHSNEQDWTEASSRRKTLETSKAQKESL